MGGRTQVCLAGEEPTLMEELRAMAQHQLAIHSLGLPGDTAQEIVNTSYDPSPAEVVETML